MNGHRIVFTKPGHAELQNFAVREPNNNEVVVKVKYTLISAGTEKAFLMAQPNTGAHFPIMHGYSSVGVVVRVGSLVKKFRPGDRVFVAYGGHASYNVKSLSDVFKIPDNVSFEDAIFTKVASYPLLAIRRAQFELGESVAIVGLGMLGLFGVQLAKIAGGLPVIAIGNREVRRSIALECGADFVFDPNDPDLTEKVKNCSKITWTTGGANVVIETSGNIDALISALKYTTKWGRVVVTGCNRVVDKPIDLYNYIHKQGISLIGAHGKTRPQGNSMPGNWTTERDFNALFGFLSAGALRPHLLQPEYVSPSAAKDIYQSLITDRNFPLGVVFDWEKM